MRKFNWPFGIGVALIMLVVLQLSDCEGAWVFPSAGAGEANLTWTPPTKNCDGSAITNLQSYILTYGQVKQELPLAPQSKTVTGLTPGFWWFSLAAKNSAGEVSQFVTAEKTILPGEFVTKTNKVYTFFRTNGNITLTVTPHTVGLGVTCDATQTVNGKFRVPLEAVTWNGSKLTAALADCG
jgi:hypothetical protein